MASLFESLRDFFPSNSRIVKKTNSLFHLASIPFSVVEGKILSSNPNGPQCSASKKEPNSRVLAKGDRILLAKNPMVSMKICPRTNLIITGFHGANDANCRAPSSSHNIAIPKLICNGLHYNVTHAHETFVIRLGDEPSSPSVNGHHLVPKKLDESPCLLPHFVQDVFLI